ncbi:MAG: 2-isopropylmalate synthase [Clostridiales bacterium]|nr:2-isopropylmalate synthase [Clostridiales bacterium]
MDQVKIFDTTLRDGEQSPGCSMNLREKIEVARCLEKLKVDIIEAGFAIASPGDFESVKTISETIKDCTIASLARSTVKDIDTAWEAVKGAVDPRIHVFIATSPLHMEYKLKMKPEQVLEQAGKMVAYAKKYCSDIEFSAEDATRSNIDFLKQVVEVAIANGATTINLPDTVGYTTPEEMRYLISEIKNNVRGAEKVIFSVHCHNDLGMATANSLAGVAGGARQIECTINGLGERAGNTSLEEIVMALRTRQDLSQVDTRIDTTQIHRASSTVYNIIGQTAPLNKPIVGKNAFAHESGIHQHGVLANKKTYEIMTPETVGIRVNNLVLGKHSGRHAVASRLEELGYTLSKEELDRCFEEFKIVCDKKKNITDADLEAIVNHNTQDLYTDTEEGYKLDWFQLSTSNFTTATCTVSLIKDDEKAQDVALGDGPIDAAYNAIDAIIQPSEHSFDIFNIHSISEGKDTLGDVTVKVNAYGRTFTGRGLSTDIMEASINAYLKALNRMQAYEKKIQKSDAKDEAKPRIRATEA